MVLLAGISSLIRAIFLNPISNITFQSQKRYLLYYFRKMYVPKTNTNKDFFKNLYNFFLHCTFALHMNIYFELIALKVLFGQ